MGRKPSLTCRKWQHKKKKNNIYQLVLSINKLNYIKQQLKHYVLPHDWISTTWKANEIKICKVTGSGNGANVSHCLTIFQDFAYNITSFNHPISLDIPTKYIYNLENLTTVVNTLDSLHICPGNLEMEFIQLSIKSNGQFKDSY